MEQSRYIYTKLKSQRSFKKVSYNLKDLLLVTLAIVSVMQELDISPDYFLV